MGIQKQEVDPDAVDVDVFPLDNSLSLSYSHSSSVPFLGRWSVGGIALTGRRGEAPGLGVAAVVLEAEQL